MDKRRTFPIDAEWVTQLLAWAVDRFPYLAYFSSQEVSYPHEGFDELFFAGHEAFSLEQMKSLPSESEKIGILSYDLKNRFERLSSRNPALIETPESVFFTPCLKIKIAGKTAEIFHAHPEHIFAEVCKHPFSPTASSMLAIAPLTSREEYLRTAEQVKKRIVEGDIYEINYCMAYSASFGHLDPLSTYVELMKKSPMPFSVFFKAKHQYLVSASPERFLKRSGSRIIAQPIKGTIKRGISDEEDLLLQQQLRASEKERAENLMIVDLMRNDLARIARTGTVQVEELYGIYPFKRVSQMISTVSAMLKPHIPFEEIIEKTFPMGSMTGAPKIKAMELIDHHENFKRGWFSGAVGYIHSNGDFDFNVVIRSIVIDEATNKLFFAVGSAITYDADPLQEYEECLLKAQPIFEVLSSTGAQP